MFILEGLILNASITSREAIMQVCRRIAADEGMKALNMRRVVGECHVALGTLYNYYADKDSLVLATVESIWKDIFHSEHENQAKGSFPDYVADLYACIQRGARAYPGFLTGHSIAIASARRGEARDVMDHTLSQIRAGMLSALRNDPSVRESAFSPELSEEAFAGFVLDNLLLLLMRGQPDCTMLLEIIRRAIGGQGDLNHIIRGE